MNSPAYIGGAAVTEENGRAQLITLYTRVLLHLAQNPRVSQEMLARRLDVTMRTVQRHLTELEEEGYISVDRNKKPFQYSVNWSMEWPYLPGLRLIILHPDVIDALRGLSDVASRAYETASEEGVDESEALRAIFAAEPGRATVT
jgi:DNA-binding transcriptional MocR family regulator